jgi:hypothetical protein
MDSSTFGLPKNSRLGYRETINYATRISIDGIYMHQLDATVWAQGNTNTRVVARAKESERFRRLHYVASIAFEQTQELSTLGLRHIVLHQGGSCMLHVRNPLPLRNVEARVRCLHVTPDVDTWPAAELTDLVDQELSGPVV